MNEKCPSCDYEMELESDDFEGGCVYWWECCNCGSVYSYDKKTLLFVNSL